MASMPEQAARAALTGFVNHLLRAEAWARGRLAPHAGKTIRFRLSPFVLNLSVTDDGLLGSATEADHADVALTLALAALPRIATAALDEDPQAAAMRHIRIEGDADLAQAMAALFRYLRWDVEDDLSRIVGDVAAHRIVGGARSVAAQARRTQERMIDNLVEYLTEEQPALVTRERQDSFAENVRLLREDLDRLDQRIARLARR